MNKKIVNIIYNHHYGEPSIHYENNNGIVQINGKKIDGEHNLFMGLDSVQNPTPEDSLYILEPRCVAESEYNPDLIDKFKYIFTWADAAFAGTHVADKVVALNHPSCLGAQKIEEYKKHWVPWSERNNEIVFIANNKRGIHDSQIYNLRIELADLLHGFSRKYKVSWYGNIPLNKPYFRGPIDSKFEVLRRAKFSICTENCYDSKFSKNYFSEKMPEVLFAGAVPIYMGCYNIDEFGFGSDLYIDLRKFTYKHKKQHQVNHDALLNTINSYSEGNYNSMLAALDATANSPNGLYNVISYERAYSKMIDSFV